MRFTPQGRKVFFSTLWTFVTVNYLYADVLLMLGEVGPTTPGEAEAVAAMSTPGMMLFAAIYLEMGMMMIVFSRVLPYSMNRWSNIVIAILHIAGGVASLFVMAPPLYVFFVVVEVITLLFIVWYAWSWRNPSPAGSAA